AVVSTSEIPKLAYLPYSPRVTAVLRFPAIRPGRASSVAINGSYYSTRFSSLQRPESWLFLEKTQVLSGPLLAPLDRRRPPAGLHRAGPGHVAQNTEAARSGKRRGRQPRRRQKGLQRRDAQQRHAGQRQQDPYGIQEQDRLSLRQSGTDQLMMKMAVVG